MKFIYCSYQNYNWGKKGSCLVSNFIKHHINETISDNDHYAELWISMHHKLPSYLDCEKTDALNIEYVQTRLEKSNYNIPIVLTKLLSVGKPLSIQLHPDKKNAIELHESLPMLYLDDNSKNELIVALTNFKLLCGFNQISNIIKIIECIY